MPADRLIRSARGVGGLTLVSRVLGLARDWGLVRVFGAGRVLDAFLLAFTIPNLFRRLFGEGALTSAFLPVFVELREREGADPASRFASAVLTALGLFLAAVTAAGILACWAAWSVAGADSPHALTLRLAAVMLPFLVFICVSALCAAMLQGVRRFLLPAGMPVLLNLAFIAALLYVHLAAPGAGERTIFYVAGAVVAAGVVQVLVQAAALRGAGVRLGWRADWAHPGLLRVLRAMGPTALGLAVFQVNVLVDRLIAYVLIPGDGPLTHLYLGNRLMQLPLGLFGIALATTAFPDLVSHTVREEWSALYGKVATGLRYLAFLLLPAAAGLMALSEPLVRALFQNPDLAFDDPDVYRTAAVLACYAPGLLFIAVQQLLTRLFYARGDYRTPVRITLYMVGLNLVLNLLLIHAPDLYRSWARGEPGWTLGEAGLALSTSLVAMITVGVMWRRLRRAAHAGKARAAWDRAFGALPGSVGRIAAAAAATGVFAYLVARSIPAEPELWVRLERGLVPVVLGLLAYGVACLIVPVPELGEFMGRRGKNKDNTKTKNRER